MKKIIDHIVPICFVFSMLFILFSYTTQTNLLPEASIFFICGFIALLYEG